MSVIDQLRERYSGMDPVQRQNFWFAVVGAILVILLILSLGDAYMSVMKFLGWGD